MNPVTEEIQELTVILQGKLDALGHHYPLATIEAVAWFEGKNGKRNDAVTLAHLRQWVRGNITIDRLIGKLEANKLGATR